MPVLGSTRMNETRQFLMYPVSMIWQVGIRESYLKVCRTTDISLAALYGLTQHSKTESEDIKASDMPA